MDTGDVDRLADRLIGSIVRIATRVRRFASFVLAIALVASVAGFLLGLKALDGGMRSVWTVLGSSFGAIAVGAAFLAWWRVGAICRHVPEMATEIRSMLSSGGTSTRQVIDTFVVDTDGDGDRDLTAPSVIELSRSTWRLKGLAGPGVEASAHFSATVASLTSLPLLAFVAIGITVVFTGLALIFLIALAL